MDMLGFVYLAFIGEKSSNMPYKLGGKKFEIWLDSTLKKWNAYLHTCFKNILIRILGLRKACHEVVF